jgi:hypothetical protein
LNPGPVVTPTLAPEPLARTTAREVWLALQSAAPRVTTTGSRQAHLDGFDLHANVAVAANNCDGLEQLARHVLRSPIAQERLTHTTDGRVLLTLKTEWSDGTTALLFEPTELLERLTALTPHLRINLVFYHSIAASHSRWRAWAVAYGRDTGGSVNPDAALACARTVAAQLQALEEAARAGRGRGVGATLRG